VSSLSGKATRIARFQKIQNQSGFEEVDLQNDESGDTTRDEEAVSIFRKERRLYTFRGQRTPKGQYEFPFSFQLPNKHLPATFQYINDRGENFQVRYQVTAFFEDVEPLLQFTQDIVVVERQNANKLYHVNEEDLYKMAHQQSGLIYGLGKVKEFDQGVMESQQLRIGNGPQTLRKKRKLIKKPPRRDQT